MKTTRDVFRRCVFGPSRSSIAVRCHRLDRMHEPYTGGPVLSRTEKKVRNQALLLAIWRRPFACSLPKGAPEQEQIRKLIAKAKNKIPMHAEGGVYILDAWVEAADTNEDSPFSR